MDVYVVQAKLSNLKALRLLRLPKLKRNSEPLTPARPDLCLQSRSDLVSLQSITEGPEKPKPEAVASEATEGARRASVLLWDPAA